MRGGRTPLPPPPPHQEGGSAWEPPPSTAGQDPPLQGGRRPDWTQTVRAIVLMLKSGRCARAGLHAAIRKRAL